MSFGVQNLGVIDQKGTPAIWQSAFADFPASTLNGRILIATDNVYNGIYIDLNGTLVRIATEPTDFKNGLGSVGLSGFVKNIGLGGALTQNTSIDTNTKTLDFVGTEVITSVDPNGYLYISSKDVPTLEVAAFPIVADSTIRLNIRGVSFDINAKEV
jgi:hypothetical protein